jgi:hypothetical protein
VNRPYVRTVKSGAKKQVKIRFSALISSCGSGWHSASIGWRCGLYILIANTALPLRRILNSDFYDAKNRAKIRNGNRQG